MLQLTEKIAKNKKNKIAELESPRENRNFSKYHLPLVSQPAVEFGLSFYEKRLVEILAKYRPGTTSSVTPSPKYLSHKDEMWLFEIRDNAPSLKNKVCETIIKMNQNYLALALREIESVKYCAHLKREDLIQEGNIGLMRAFKKFDPDKNMRFTTYAKHWIRAYVKRGINEKERACRIPESAQTIILYAINKIRKDEAREEMNDENKTNGKNETDEKYEKDMRKSVLSDYKNGLILISQKKISARTPDKYERDARDNNVELLADERQAEQLDKMIATCDRSKLLAVISQLSEKERHVIVRYYGLDNEPPENCREIATKLNVTPGRINQLELEAIEKMRKKFKLNFAA